MFQYKHQVKKAPTLKQYLVHGAWYGVGIFCFVGCILIFAVAATGGL